MDRNTRHEMMVQFAKFDQILNELTVNMHNSMLILKTLSAKVVELEKKSNKDIEPETSATGDSTDE